MRALFYNVGHLRCSKFRFSSSWFLILQITFNVFNSLDIKPIQKTWTPNNLNSTIDPNITLLIKSLYLLIKLYIININNRILIIFSLWTNISFISFGNIASWTLTSVGFVKVLRLRNDFRLWVINISHTKSYSSHSDNWILLKFKTFSFISFLRIFIDYKPKFFLWISVNLL